MAAATVHTSKASKTNALLPTSPPAHVQHELKKRDDPPQLCGYISGDIASPLSCTDVGYTCTAEPGVTQFACCNNLNCVDLWQACMGDNLQDPCEGAGVCNGMSSYILTCSGSSPYCRQYAWSVSPSAADTYYSWGCGTTTATVSVLGTATNTRQSPPASESSVVTTSSMMSPEGTALHSSDARLSSSSKAPTKEGNTGANGEGPTHKSSIGTGAIVGIVTGAIAALVLVSLGIWWPKRWFSGRQNNIKRIKAWIDRAPTVAQQQTQVDEHELLDMDRTNRD
ncbi:hypothetical protein MBLNU13_g01177t1 [Cladosporium sp. NU13]